MFIYITHIFKHYPPWLHATPQIFWPLYYTTFFFKWSPQL